MTKPEPGHIGPGSLPLNPPPIRKDSPMSNMIKVALDQASNVQLRWFAATALNIDGIKSGQQDSFLIGKIKGVDPDVTEIEVPDNLEIDPQTGAISVGVPTPEKPQESMADLHPRARAHYKFDPKVKVHIGEAYTETKVKDVMLSVCGDTITVRRGTTVDLPYRFYLSLKQSVEHFFRDTDEVHPITQLPIKERIERPTIAHSVVGPLPSPEEIADFHARTDNLSL